MKLPTTLLRKLALSVVGTGTLIASPVVSDQQPTKTEKGAAVAEPQGDEKACDQTKGEVTPTTKGEAKAPTPKSKKKTRGFRVFSCAACGRG